MSNAVFIATDGNDSWSGLLSSPNAAGTDGPKATLQAAEVVMRNSSTIKTAYVEGGDYYLTSPLNLGPADAGESWLPFTDEAVRIHGGSVVTGWTEHANGVWTAAASSNLFSAGSGVTDLFYAGDRLTHARYPNADPTDPVTSGWLYASASSSGDNTHSSFRFNSGDIPTLNSSDDLYAVVYSQNGWRSYVLPVSSIDYSSDTIHLSGSASAALGEGSRYYLFNASSMLDSTGEWYYNASSGTISFKAPSDFSSNSQVVVGNLSTVFNIYNTSDITIAGLTITDSLSTGSAINVSNSPGIDIAGDRIRNVGVGVSFSSGSTYDTVEGSNISATNYNAVQIPSGSGHISVLGNYIHDIGNLVTSNGVWISGSSYNTVSYNYIKGVSRDGVVATATSAGVGSYHNTISYNEIANANYATSDGGAIYINGAYQQDDTGDVVAYNKIYNTNANGNVSHTGEVSASFLDTSDLISYAVYLDDYASGLSVTGNMIFDNVGGICIHGGWDNTISGNFLIANAGTSLQNQAKNTAIAAYGGSSSGNLFTANLIMTALGGLASVNLGTMANARWTHNFYDTSTLASRAFAAFVGGSYSARSLSAWEALGYDASGSSGVLRYLNAATGDFTLSSNSGAVEAGIANLPTSKMGIDGFTARNAYDLKWGSR